MADASFVQSSFLGGEWSPWMQGRLDLPKYRTAMNVCLNGIPVEEGAWVRRPGTRQLGFTRSGADGRVIGYEYQEDYPSLLEFTDSFLRVWLGSADYQLVSDTAFGIQNISTDTAPVFTTGAAHGWATGDQVFFTFSGEGIPAVFGGLQNMQWTLTVLTTTSFTITNPLTGAQPTYADMAGGNGGQTITANHILQLATPYASEDNNPHFENIRFTSLGQTASGLQGLLFLAGTKPQVITVTNPTAANPTFTIQQAFFSDGPYNDPVNGAIITPSASGQTGVLASFPPWMGGGSGHTINVGDLVNWGDSSNFNGYNYVCIQTQPQSGANFPYWFSHYPTTSAYYKLVTDVPPFASWSSSTAYAVADCVVYASNNYVAIKAGTNHEPDTSPTYWTQVGLTDLGLVDGNVTFDLSFATWVADTTYGIGDVAQYGGVNYVSTQANNQNQEPDTSPTFWSVTSAGYPFSPSGASSTDVGRSVRLFCQPTQWNSGTSYTDGAVVTYNGAYYSAIASNAGKQPDVHLQSWQPTGSATAWTWGIVTAVNSATEVVIQLVGGGLLYTNPIVVFQVGAFSDTTGWPTSGLFYQGRLWLVGAAPNRVDASTSDSPFLFSPTGSDGTVADDNGITCIFNSEDNELVQWIKGNQQGIIVGTLTREWLINASATTDPITPATVEFNPITRYGSTFVEPRVTGLATVFVQRHQKALMEMVANVFSGKYNAPNLALTAKHLTTAGIAEIAYQEELAPIIWLRCNDGSLIGCTYRRITAFQTDNPVLMNEPSTYAAWHRHDLGNNRSVQSITSTFTSDGSLPTIAMVTEDTGGKNWVELLTPIFDVENTLFEAWFVDGGAVPSSAEVSGDGVTFYGFASYAGQTVSAWVGGLDCGDYTVSAAGAVDVPYGAAAGLFTADYVTSISTGSYGDLGVPIATMGGGSGLPYTVGGIAELTVPSDAYGSPSGAVVDWANGRVFLYGTVGTSPTQTPTARVYSTTLQTQSPTISAALTAGTGIGVVGADVDPVSQCLILQFNSGQNGQEVTKYDPTTLALDATFGTISSSNDYPTNMGLVEQIVCVECNGVGYACCKQSVSSGNVAVIRCDNMTAAGFDQAVVSGDTNARGMMCRGASGAAGGSVYATYNGAVAGDLATYPLYGVYIEPGAETYSIGSWPTTNPYISTATIGNIAAASIDATWTAFTVNQLTYDTYDRNVIMDVTTATGSPTITHYIIKVSTFDASIVWVQPATYGGYAVFPTYRNYAIMGLLSTSEVYTVEASTTPGTTAGTIVTTPIGGLSTISNLEGDSLSGTFLLHTTFAVGTNSPTPVSGTPTSFTGWALMAAPMFSEVTATYQTIPAVIGSTYTSDCQIVRPAEAQESGARNGPAQGKTRRTHQLTALLQNTQGISFGTTFTHLYPFTPADYINGPEYPVTQLFSGVYWTTMDDTYTFNSMPCWRITRPYPASVMNIGGFLHTQDR